MKIVKIALVLVGLLAVNVALLALNESKSPVQDKYQQYRFTGSEDHRISLEEAAHLTRNYRNRVGDEARLGGLFAREAFDRILAQEGAAGIRFYYGEADDGTPELVLVGVDIDGNDIVHGELAERIMGCPPLCGNRNELNSDFQYTEAMSFNK